MVTKRVFLATAISGALAVLAGCGSSDSVVVGNMTAVPVLGAVYGATVEVIDKNGNVVATGTTGAKTSATPGVATLPFYASVTGPVVVKITLPPGSAYYDEKSDKDVTVSSSTTMLSMAPSVGTATEVGITPLSNAAAILAGVSAAGKPPATFTLDEVAKGVAKVNLILGLPETFNVLQKPAIATSATTIPTTGYGALIAQMAKNTTEENALAQVTKIASFVDVNGVAAGAATAIAALNQKLSTVPALAAVVKAVTGSNVAAPVTDNTTLTTRAAAAVEAVKKEIGGGGATGASGATGAKG